MSTEETNVDADPATLVGKVVRVKCFGTDKKTGMRISRVVTGTLLLADELTLIVKEPDRPAFPARQGKAFRIQAGIVESCHELARLEEIRGEAIKGLCSLVLSHSTSGTVCHIRRQFNGTFRADFGSHQWFSRKGEELLSQVEELGYSITAWELENQ